MSLSHRRLSAWYHQLAQQLEAGLSLVEALQLSRGSGLPSKRLAEMSAAILAGGTVDDALRAAGEWLPLADRLFLSAAATAGRMPRTLHVLSDRHAALGAAKLRVVIGCIYPVVLVHVGLLLLPVVRMIDWEKGFTWDLAAYGRGVCLTIGPLWVVALIIWALVKGENPHVATLSRMLPVVGTYVRAQSLSDFAFGLGNFLEAGVPIDQAWATAALVSRSPALQSAAEKIGEAIARGEPPGPKLGAWPCFPPDFIALYRSGEISGQLEQNLLRLAAVSQDEAQRALKLATVVYPGVVFLTVAVGVGYFVISIYSGYLKMLTGLAGQ
ncbi:MAG: type II secretion system F family protein [Opitutus sp.]